MMVLTVAWKTLKESVRQPKNLFLTLGLPVVFMVIFGLAFGDPESTTYQLGVLNEDEGDLGRAYVDGLGNLTYGNGEPIVVVLPIESVEAGLEHLKGGGRYDALLVVPANFSANLAPPPQGGGQTLPIPGQPQQGPPAAPAGSTVQVYGDPSSVAFNGASQVIAAYTQAFSEQASGRPAPVRAETNAVTADDLTGFDFIAPGLMIFAVLNLAPQAAAVLARESELRTLDRIRASPTRAATLLGGVALASLVMAAVSMTLMLAAAALLGFDNQGSYVVGFALIMGSAVAVVGIGLIIAAFATTQQEAANLGTMVSVPVSFLSGAFFAIPGVTLFGNVELYDLLPTTHAVAAMRRVMTFGQGLDAIATELASLGGLALLYFAVGILLYRARRLAPE